MNWRVAKFGSCERTLLQWLHNRFTTACFGSWSVITSVVNGKVLPIKFTISNLNHETPDVVEKRDCEQSHDKTKRSRPARGRGPWAVAAYGRP